MYTWEGSTSPSSPTVSKENISKINKTKKIKEIDLDEDWKVSEDVDDDKYSAKVYSEPEKENVENVDVGRRPIETQNRKVQTMKNTRNEAVIVPKKISRTEPQNIYFRRKAHFKNFSMKYDSALENDNHQFLLNFLNLHNSDIYRSLSEPHLNASVDKSQKSQYIFPRKQVSAQYFGKLITMEENQKQELIKTEQEKEVEVCEIIPEYVLV